MPFVNTSPKSPVFIPMKWLSSYRTNSIYCRRHPASNVLFRGLAGPKRQRGRNPKNRILNYEIFISTSCLSFVPIIWFSLMNLDMINGWITDGLVGHHWAWHLCKCLNSTGASDIRYSQHTLRMVSFYLAFSKIQLMACSSNRSLSNSSSTVGDGRNQNLCLLWTMLPSIIQTELSNCALMRVSDCCTYPLILQISIPLRNFLPNWKLTSRKPGQALRWNLTKGFRPSFDGASMRSVQNSKAPKAISDMQV